jgi:hypothetical protein
MATDEERARLQQQENLEQLINKKLSTTDMLTVYYSSEEESNHNRGIYCALIPNSKVETIISNSSWDFLPGSGHPYYDNDKDTPKYYHYGNDNGIEPFIIDRNFNEIHPSHKEINEEFRLFHNLYHDTKTNKYLKINDSDDTEVVAIIEENKISIRLQEIREFLTAKKMHLSIQFDYKEFSLLSLEELNLSSKQDSKQKSNELHCWSLCIVSGENAPQTNYKSFSTLRGKKLIKPFDKMPEKTKKYADFIIGVDDNGNKIEASCNYNLLGKPADYLTPVCFKKTVLEKYYNQSSKFTVEDRSLRGPSWGLIIDNLHKDKVCVWLGDLGRDLPCYEEQLHWRSHNIAPNGNMSETFLASQLGCKFNESEQPDHLFIKNYNLLMQACNDCLDFQLLLQLKEKDSHCLTIIRIPATEEQLDFDEIILALTKILIDSINEKQLKKIITSDAQPNINGSINLLEQAFIVLKVKDYKRYVTFLRNLQELRSSGTAHRKGKKYNKIIKELGSEDSSLIDRTKNIIEQANAYLIFLKNIVENVLSATEPA